MITIRLILTNVPQGIGILGWRSNMGIEMSRWCREHELMLDRDYDWAFLPKDNALQFRFYNENESFASLFAIRWAEYL